MYRGLSLWGVELGVGSVILCEFNIKYMKNRGFGGRVKSVKYLLSICGVYAKKSLYLHLEISGVCKRS